MRDFEDKVKAFDQTVLAALLKGVSETPQQAAIDLLRYFNSFQEAARADKQILANIVGDKAADLLLAIPQAVTSMTRERLLKASSYILTLNAAKLHFASFLNGRRNEALVVLYLNARNKLIDEDIWNGSIDRISVYPREIFRRVLLLDASAVLIAHNHPSGDPSPSPEDIRLTERLQTGLDYIEVVLIDHMIFGEGEPYSLRENGDI